jgi:acyl carrier protein
MAPQSQSAAPEIQPPVAPAGDMQPAEILSRIKQIIANVAGLDAGRIPDHAMLREELNLDSLSLLEIGVDVDFTFKLNLPDERYKEVQSLDDMVDLVVHRFAEPARPEAV